MFHYKNFGSICKRGLQNLTHASSSPASTHFGFEKVSEDEKVKKVHTVFANVADKYDLMNDVMSLGIHRLWKDYFVETINPAKEATIIDVAGGTGDIAFRLARQISAQNPSPPSLVVYDINQKMLDVGEYRAQNDKSVNVEKFKWVCGDAEDLPFDNDTFDLYTIAFGIRNCTHVDKVLSEAHRVLKPGGMFACLEFSKICQPLKPIYDLYSFQLIPLMGQVIASDYNSYKYLVESIRMFPDQEEFCKMVSAAGFRDVSYQNLSLDLQMLAAGRYVGCFRRRDLISRKFYSAQAELMEVGRISEPKVNSRYKPGQLFLHRVFAYRGIILCSFESKYFGRKESNNQFEVVPYYQVLIHRPDWKEIRFAHDMTAYLSDNQMGRDKTLAVINGMDCVAHADIIPFTMVGAEGRDPIEHDLFRRLFKPADEHNPELGYVNYREQHNMQQSWMAPQMTYSETSEKIRVNVTTFYLGQSIINEQVKHCWRYVIRLQNLDDRPAILRERIIKVFSLNQLALANSGELVEDCPRLSPEYPAYQYSSTIDLLQHKGGHMWGKFKMEREDGSFFDINLPTVLLESNTEFSGQSNETVIN